MALTPCPIFVSKKKRIIESLSAPGTEYSDLSPKGSVDKAIRAEIDLINQSPVLVTTSSCSGRISVFLEGRKAGVTAPSVNVEDGIEALQIDQTPSSSKNTESVLKPSQVGGKGVGGKWLFVSHEPIDEHSKSEMESNENDSKSSQLKPKVDRSTGKWHRLFHMNPGATPEDPARIPDESTSFVHFKFEPFILHVLTASLEAAQAVVTAAFEAGFRESGVVGLAPHPDGTITPVVAVRSQGVAFESIVGFELPEHAPSQPSSSNGDVNKQADGPDGSGADCAPGPPRRAVQSFVSDSTLDSLVQLANSRFRENSSRIEKFVGNLRRRASVLALPPTDGGEPSPEGQAAKKESKEERRQRKRQAGLARQQALQREKETEQHDCGCGKEENGEKDGGEEL